MICSEMVLRNPDSLEVFEHRSSSLSTMTFAGFSQSMSSSIVS